MRADDYHDADLQDGEKVDRAVRLAFADAIRRHWAANVPMVMWEAGEVREVSPFDIPLPDDPPEPPKRRAHAGD